MPYLGTICLHWLLYKWPEDNHYDEKLSLLHMYFSSASDV